MDDGVGRQRYGVLLHIAVRKINGGGFECADRGRGFCRAGEKDSTRALFSAEDKFATRDGTNLHWHRVPFDTRSAGRNLVHPNVVHDDIGRSRSGVIRVSRPVAAHCQVHDQIERVVEHPLAIFGKVADILDEEYVGGVVDVELDHPGRPDDAVSVESSVVDSGAVSKVEVAAETIPESIARCMERGSDGRRSEAVGSGRSNIFNDIHRTRRRPARLVEVGSEHPESRPKARADGQFHAGFDPSVLELLQPARGDSSRRPISIGVPLGAQDEVTFAILKRVRMPWIAAFVHCRACGAVGLQLVVSPTVLISDVEVPLGWVGRLHGRAIEFVTPNRDSPFERLKLRIRALLGMASDQDTGIKD